MVVRPLATGGTSVRCPDCGASRVFAAPSAPPGSICHAAFFHESDTCPVLLRIQDLLRKVSLGSPGGETAVAD